MSVNRGVLSLAVAVAALAALAWFGLANLDTGEPRLIGGLPVSAAESVAPPAPSLAALPAGSGSAPVVDPAWVQRTAAAAGIPTVAVAAYAAATLAAPSSCDLGWTTLAGLGWVESQHGTIGGRTLDATGRPSAPIIGPALDGVGKVAAIHASAAGTALHGDAEWDHAVGPMQFLPSTWATWARDGDGDGSADPQDLYDAAAAAAAYLCGTGQDLTTGPGWSAAIFAYNHSASYVDQVYAAATAYADRTA